MNKIQLLKRLFQDLGVTEITVSKRGFVYRVRLIDGIHKIAAERGSDE